MKNSTSEHYLRYPSVMTLIYWRYWSLYKVKYKTVKIPISPDTLDNSRDCLESREVPLGYFNSSRDNLTGPKWCHGGAETIHFGVRTVDIPQIRIGIFRNSVSLKTLEINLQSPSSPNLAIACCGWPKSRHRRCLIAIEAGPNHSIEHFASSTICALLDTLKTGARYQCVIKVADMGSYERVRKQHFKRA